MGFPLILSIICALISLSNGARCLQDENNLFTNYKHCMSCKQDKPGHCTTDCKQVGDNTADSCMTYLRSTVQDLECEDQDDKKGRLYECGPHCAHNEKCGDEKSLAGTYLCHDSTVCDVCKPTTGYDASCLLPAALCVDIKKLDRMSCEKKGRFSHGVITNTGCPQPDMYRIECGPDLNWFSLLNKEFTARHYYPRDSLKGNMKSCKTGSKSGMKECYISYTNEPHSYETCDKFGTDAVPLKMLTSKISDSPQWRVSNVYYTFCVNKFKTAAPKNKYKEYVPTKILNLYGVSDKKPKLKPVTIADITGQESVASSNPASIATKWPERPKRPVPKAMMEYADFYYKDGLDALDAMEAENNEYYGQHQTWDTLTFLLTLINCILIICIGFCLGFMGGGIAGFLCAKYVNKKKKENQQQQI